MSCQDVKAVTIRPGVCRFKAEIQFNPTLLADKYLDQHPGKSSEGIDCLKLIVLFSSPTILRPPPLRTGGAGP